MELDGRTEPNPYGIGVLSAGEMCGTATVDRKSTGRFPQRLST
jgi:hypothetical protein